MAELVGKPEQQVMGDGKLDAILADKSGLLVKQTMRGCLQECLGCEAKSEYKISAMDWSMIQNEYKVSSEGMKQQNIMYAIEKSNCCVRLCWRDGRPFDLKVSEGGEKGGEQLLNFRKPCGCPLYFSIPTKDGSIDCPCCCALPHLFTELPGGAPLGSDSRYICDMYLCVPKLKYSESGEPVYILRPETCCGGCCIACNCCSGKGLVYVPFYFHEPASMKVVGGDYGKEGTPQIRKMWAGLKKECCSTADTFAVMFPQGIDVKRKAGLLGLTFLLDFTIFERQQEGQ